MSSQDPTPGTSRMPETSAAADAPATPPGGETVEPPGTTAPSSAPVTRGWLIGVGAAVVVLSFVAAFLGGWLARSASTREASATPVPTATAEEAVDYEEVLEDILPAGSAVRAGTCVIERRRFCFGRPPTNCQM